MVRGYPQRRPPHETRRFHLGVHALHSGRMESVQGHVRAHPAVPRLLDRLQGIQALWRSARWGQSEERDGHRPTGGPHEARPLLLTFLLACTPDGHSGRTLGNITASSLQDAFTDIAEGFEQGTLEQVEIVVAGSHTLAAQVRHGLEADVLASADPELLEALVTDDLAHPSEP